MVPYFEMLNKENYIGIYEFTSFTYHGRNHYESNESILHSHT